MQAERYHGFSLRETMITFATLNYPFILKFSSVTNLSDARYAAGMWADIIGFCFDPGQPEYIEPGKAAEIIAWVSGPEICGEFGQQPAEWILEFAEKLNLNSIQIPAVYPEMKSLLSSGLKIICTISDSREFIPEIADMLLCRESDIYMNVRQKTGKPLIFESDTVPELLPLPEGIALKGQAELLPGTRNHAEWTTFLEKWQD